MIGSSSINPRIVFSFFNQPGIKESTKNVLGAITFIFGVIEVCDEIVDCYRSLANRTHHPHQKGERWCYAALKVINIAAKISLLGSAITSRPGLNLTSRMVKCIFNDDQLLRYFGPNRCFAETPYHPRHVASIISFLLGIPATLQTFFEAGEWLKNLITRRQQLNRKQEIQPRNIRRWLTDQNIRWMTAWNTLTSRPALHLTNRLFRMFWHY